MGDVAEGILVLVEPAIRGDVDAPARHVLAVMVAWGQPRHLDHAGSGRLVAVTGQMRDADTHERRQPVCKGRTYRTACARPSRGCYSAVLKPIALPISDIARGWRRRGGFFLWCNPFWSFVILVRKRTPFYCCRVRP